MQAAMLALERPGNLTTCRLDADSAWTDVRWAATLQTDRQIKELSVENNDCALLVHVEDLISVLLVNLTKDIRPVRCTSIAHIMMYAHTDTYVQCIP